MPNRAVIERTRMPKGFAFWENETEPEQGLGVSQKRERLLKASGVCELLGRSSGWNLVLYLGHFSIMVGSVSS